MGVVANRSLGGPPLVDEGLTCGIGVVDGVAADVGMESESAGDLVPEFGRDARDGALTGGRSRGADPVDIVAAASMLLGGTMGPTCEFRFFVPSYNSLRANK